MSNRYYATGRRKEAAARVWISPGSGQITVNKRTLEDFFPRATLRMIINQPFTVGEVPEQWDVTCTVRGGGNAGQAGAIRHGIAHALVNADAGLRPKLKRAGLLTRDARRVERKKYGRPGARKRFQYSKR